MYHSKFKDKEAHVSFYLWFSRQKGHIYYSKFKVKQAHVSFYLWILIDKRGTRIILLVGSQDKRGTCIILNLKTMGHMYYYKFKDKEAHVSFYLWVLKTKGAHASF